MIFKTIDDGARYEGASPDHGIEFSIDRLRRDRHELIGELSVACGILGARVVDGCLSAGTFNVSSPRARQDRAKLLAQRSRTDGKIDWHGLVEEFCQRILKAERVGTPSLILRDVPKPITTPEYDVAGFRFPQHQPTILFGDGGSAKSYFALFVGATLAASGQRVALADWEMDASQHRLRLERLFPGAMPDVRYIRCEKPLVYEVDRLTRIARTDRLDYTIFDSAGYACSGKPEDAESALQYFRCVRAIGTGSLHVAHVNKSDNAEFKPYGSAFWHNSARATWFVKLAGTSPDGQVATIGLLNRKANLGALQPPLAYDVTFMSERTVILPVDVNKVDELAANLPMWQRLKSALTAGPRTLASLADALDVKVDTIDRTVRRKSDLFTRVTRDGIAHISLVERRVG